MSPRVRSVDPLQYNVPIVDAGGRPTAQFIRQWQQAQGVGTAVGDAADSLDGLETGLAEHAASTTNVHGIADTASLVVTTDPRMTNARPPTAHNHNSLYYTKTEIDAALANYVTATSLVMTLGEYVTNEDLTAALENYAPIIHSHTFASITSKPTTLSGYGITDAATSGHSHVISSLSGTLAYTQFPTIAGTWNANGNTVDLLGALRTSMAITARVANGTTAALIARTTTNTTAPFVVRGDAVIEIGDGTAARDSFIERIAPGFLQFTNTRFQVRMTAATSPAFSASTGGANAEFLFFVNGEQQWGLGGASVRDTRLRRSGVSTLMIDTPAGAAADLIVTGRSVVGTAGQWGGGAGVAHFLADTTTMPTTTITSGALHTVDPADGKAKVRTRNAVTTYGA